MTHTRLTESLTVTVGRRIKARLDREGRGARTRLANVLGIGRATLWRRLAGQYPWTTDEIDAAAEHLDVPAAVLLGLEDDEPW